MNTDNSIVQADQFDFIIPYIESIEYDSGCTPDDNVSLKFKINLPHNLIMDMEKFHSYFVWRNLYISNSSGNRSVTGEFLDKTVALYLFSKFNELRWRGGGISEIYYVDAQDFETQKLINS